PPLTATVSHARATLSSYTTLFRSGRRESPFHRGADLGLRSKTGVSRAAGPAVSPTRDATVSPQRAAVHGGGRPAGTVAEQPVLLDQKSTRLNSSHVKISYAVYT